MNRPWLTECQTRASQIDHGLSPESTAVDWAIGAGTLLAVTGVMFTVRDHLGVLNVLLIYLLAVLVVSIFTQPRIAAVMAVASFVLFDLIFIPPYYRLTIASSDHVLTVFAYLGVALVTSVLVARLRTRTEMALREKRRTEMLYELNRALIADVTESEILQTIVSQVVRISGAAACQILVPTNGFDQLDVRASFPLNEKTNPDRQMMAMAEWALKNRKSAGLGQSRIRIGLPKGMQPDILKHSRSSASVLYVPIATTIRAIGVLEVHDLPVGAGQDLESILISFANQAALALERGRLSDEAAQAALLAESDELKSTLLAGVSHDLRTPLAVIKAASSSLLDHEVTWSESDRETFVQAIDEETDRLTLMVSNLLDLSRIEGGVLRPEFAWQDVGELVDDVCRRLNSRGSAVEHSFTAVMDRSASVACFDYVEISQVLMNLGENAIKYAGPGKESTITVSIIDDTVQIAVRDQGPGLEPGMNKKVFGIFYREKGKERISGIGIGLAISEGIVSAHGGRIWAENATDGPGAVFTFTLPISGDGRCRDD